MTQRAREKNNTEASGEELIAALRQDYGKIEMSEMFSRYRQMYRIENVQVKDPDAINPPGLLSYLRTALGPELVDENGKRISFRTFKSKLRRAVQFLDGYYATVSVSDRFRPGQQLGPLMLQSIGRLVQTLEDAGDEPAQYAESIAEYVLKNTDQIVQENATTIGARLKGVVQRAKGRRE